MAENVDTVLWMDTVIKLGGTELNQFLECLMQLRSYMTDHGTALGFAYHPTPAPNWWDGLTPPFKARAKASGAKVWLIPADAKIEQLIADTKELRQVAPGFVMDVFSIEKSNGTEPPTWFVVYKTATHKWLVLAGETEGDYAA